LVALFALLPNPAAALYGAKSDVIKLTKDNFQRELFSGDVWILEFYAPWCGHCKALTPKYDAAATQLKGIAKLGAIDCDVERELCGAAGVQGFPTLKTWNGKDFDPKTGPKLLDYQGARETAALVNAARGLLTGSYIKMLSSAAALDDWLQQSADVPHVLLLSDKDKVSDLYKAVSMQFAGRAACAQVNAAKAAEVAERFGASQLPLLLAIPSAGADPVRLDEKISVASVKTFVASVALPAKQQGGAGGQQQQQQQQRTPEPAGPVKIHKVTNQEQFDEFCGSKPTGACFISAFSPDEEDGFSGYFESLRAAAEKHKNRFHFVWVDGTQQLDMLNHFNLRSGLPAAVVYSPSKMAAAPFVGAWDESSLQSFMSGIGTGKLRLGVVRGKPVVQSVKEEL